MTKISIITVTYNRAGTEATTDFQRTFNDYLDSLRSVISYAAQIYGFVHVNGSEDGEAAVSCPVRELCLTRVDSSGFVYTIPGQDKTSGREAAAATGRIGPQKYSKGSQKYSKGSQKYSKGPQKYSKGPQKGDNC